ncbi:type II toxin-antitoxin system prevent-host-death family antitoxin [soil metagenome]
MQIMGAFQAKTHFSALLEQVEKGEQVLITKHGRPVAKLVSVTGVDQTSIRQAINQLKEFAKQNKLNGLDWKTLRDEGRR